MRQQSLKVLVTILMVCFIPCYVISQVNFGRQYTEEHPLVYEDAWDLWPYVYLNDHGEPEGFNVDLLKELFSELNIPFVIKLKPTREALEDLRSGRSDLMLRLEATFHDDYAYYGEEVVQLFTHSVVSPKSKPVDVKSLKGLGSRQVIVHSGSLSHRMMIDQGIEAKVIPYDDMKEAIQKVSLENHGVILWNTMSLKWLMRKFQTDNLQITPIDMPHGKYKFMSNDTVLLRQLDSTYAHFCSTERLQPIQNRWFYPERNDSGIPEWVTYAVVVVGFISFLLLYYMIVLRIRERHITHLIDKHNKRLSLIMNMTKIRVGLFNIADNSVVWMADDGELEPQSYSFESFGSAYTEESFCLLTDTLGQVTSGRKDSCSLVLTADEEHDSRVYFAALSVFRRSSKGTPMVVVGMMVDQTERLEKQREIKDNLLRYQSVFSTSMVDMTYYNTEGILTNINQKACETFGCNREELLSEQVPFTFAMEDNNLTVDTFEGSYTTHIIKPDGNKSLAKSISVSENVYYEQQLIPVYDVGNRFLGIFGSGRNVSEFVNSYHKLKRSISQLTLAATDITDYINNINYALHVGGVRLANYSPSSHLLTIYKEMNSVQLTLTQTRCLSLADEHSRRLAMRLFNNMDMRSDDAIDANIDTVIRAPGGGTLSLQFHFIPIFDENGQLDNYFGLCRDVSQEKATERELQREKIKAQEVENVKNVFLRNMSHEIRTPIATVVGFAQLFVTDHDPADEESFINEIKDNANYLLKLVNDILFLSRLDAHMIEFNKSSVDIALSFEGHCQMGWSRDMKPGVDFRVESPYERLVVEIDDANVGKIVEQISEFAARSTEKGMVRARYDYIGDKLLITIEDTGCGIDTSLQESLFERFGSAFKSAGTGLGLPICKELATQMGGSIYINSAAEKGTTVWIVIPCKATFIEKKLLSS